MSANTPPPNLPGAPTAYDQRYMNQLTNVLGLFFRRITAVGPVVGTKAVLTQLTRASTITAAVNATQTTIPVAVPAFFPTSGFATLGPEKIYWDGISGSVLQNVLRGQLGTTATTHLSGAVIIPSAEMGTVYVHPTTNALFWLP